MKIVFVSTEVAPWSKTGGLGDVVGSLPVELAKRGHKVMTVAPRYDQYKGAWDTSVRVDALARQRVASERAARDARVRDESGDRISVPRGGRRRFYALRVCRLQVPPRGLLLSLRAAACYAIS